MFWDLKAAEELLEKNDPGYVQVGTPAKGKESFLKQASLTRKRAGDTASWQLDHGTEGQQC
jgi:hypothetical protein